jgi:hypothetical protein
MPQNVLTPMDIILVQIDRLENSSCQLKDFLCFLNFFQVAKPIRFSYVPCAPLLHAHLTLKENILLESIPYSLTTSKEFQLQNSLDQTGNEYLWQLFKQIPSLDVYPKDVVPQTHKAIAIIKALLGPNDYLLLEHPQEGFEGTYMEMLIEALKYQAQHLKKIIMLYGPQTLWAPHCNKKIIEHQGQYEVLSISAGRPAAEEEGLIFHNLSLNKDKDKAA